MDILKKGGKSQMTITRTECPFELNFPLCSSELNAILLVLNKDITHFRVSFFIFGPCIGMGVARAALEKFSQLDTFFLG